MTTPRQHRGRNAHASGVAAEEMVARLYEQDGHVVAERRWRGQGGEIDLVLRDGRRIVFVEVKKARDHARAAQSLRPGQIDRLRIAAEEFLSGQPDGALTEARFDVALVDQLGRCQVLHNALM